MQIHLSDITDSEGKIIQFSSEVELDKISFQMGEFPILDRSPVELRIANTGNKVLELTGKGSLTVGIPCDRCLEQVSVTIPYDIDRKLDMKQTDKERVENLESHAFDSLCCSLARLIPAFIPVPNWYPVVYRESPRTMNTNMLRIFKRLFIAVIF